jgi:hypothetical protein
MRLVLHKLSLKGAGLCFVQPAVTTTETATRFVISLRGKVNDCDKPREKVIKLRNTTNFDKYPALLRE